MFAGSHTLPFPAPCLGLFLHLPGFHPQQTLVWPWQTWSGSSQHKLRGQTKAAAAGGKKEPELDKAQCNLTSRFELSWAEFPHPCPKSRRTVENQKIYGSIYCLGRISHKTDLQLVNKQKLNVTLQ